MSSNKNEYLLQYKVYVGQNLLLDYKFEDDKNGLSLVNNRKLSDTEWIKLDYKKCANCPLNSDEYNTCPVAENLASMVADCSNTISHESVNLEVISNQRTVIAKTSAQKALSSVVGLAMATSGCPHTQFFRAMAKFHLPLASTEETVFRAVSSYLLMQYLKQKEGQNVSFDLSGLKDIYNNLHTVNVYMHKRLTSIIEADSAVNAVAILDIFAITLPNFLDEEIKNLKSYFNLNTVT